MYKKALLIVALAACAMSEDVYRKCGDDLSCLESEMIGYVDGLGDGPVPLLGDYVSLARNEETFEAARGGEDFVTRCIRYLANHELKFKLPSDTARALIEESRSSKLKKIVLPMLLLLKLKAAIILPIVLSVIALVAFKGLGAGLVALALSGATGLKSLLEGHNTSKFTYEVVPQISSHWSRSGVEPLTALPAGYHTIP
ncbi:uncharacterized protein LOC109598924 [Aethina tumida]|uniref:uncharacterized protein LOC109598924 n=1 Tax=Aethina tumida TaxID=116153 RepID=UPI00096B160A|nr:uncharacterized protein LOC109598924 [Aethina tumida]